MKNAKFKSYNVKKRKCDLGSIQSSLRELSHLKKNKEN
jgi:hypothetical protein